LRASARRGGIKNIALLCVEAEALFMSNSESAPRARIFYGCMIIGARLLPDLVFGNLERRRGKQNSRINAFDACILTHNQLLPSRCAT
jgi:hypothetical protein